MDTGTRPLTEPERRYLEWWVRHGTLPAGPSVMDKILVSCAGAGCLTLLAYVAAGLLMQALMSIAATHRAAQSIRGAQWTGLAGFALPIVIWIGMLIYMFVVRRRKPPPDFQDPKKQIEQDLSDGNARIHRFRATEVMLAHADERRLRHYFVRLEDGRVLFLGPWRPPACKVQGLSFLPDEKGFPSREFEISATPTYLLILDVAGTGEYLRPTDEFELNEEPDGDLSRLESGSFVDVPWEKIRKSFG